MQYLVDGLPPPAPTPVYPRDMSLAFRSCSLTAVETICTHNVCTLACAGVYAILQEKCLRIAALDQTAQVGILPLPLNAHMIRESCLILVPQLLHLSVRDTNSANLIAFVRIK